MKRIVFLALDERPCNYRFPYEIFQCEDFQIDRIGPLGDKKTPADIPGIVQAVKQKCVDADAAVLSLDTLLYGGLLPSRLHRDTAEAVQARLELLRQIKRENPALKLYAFQCIMRCPGYSSSDEEPDYYEVCGEYIHKLGHLLHKKKLGLPCDYEEAFLRSKIKPEFLEDYEWRRGFNLKFNLETLKLVKDGVLDFLIIPQDDAAPYGYTAMDQTVIRKRIAGLEIMDRVLLYPGADEVAMTLLARALNESRGKRPKVYVRYASVLAPFMIPLCEDRSLGETVRYHIMASGGIQTDSAESADLILAVSAGANKMLCPEDQPAENSDYDVERNLTEFVYAIETYISEGKPVTIGDNAYLNCSDLMLVKMLEKKGLLLRVAGYSGWNTSSNTLGTALAEGVKYLYYGNDAAHKNFLVLRYLEDAAYDAHVRGHVTEEILPGLGMSYYDVKQQQGIASEIVKRELQAYMEAHFPSIAAHTRIESVKMPWRRMFETDIQVAYQEND